MGNWVRPFYTNSRYQQVRNVRGGLVRHKFTSQIKWFLSRFGIVGGSATPPDEQ